MLFDNHLMVSKIRSDYNKLPGFSVAHDMYSSYAFTTITSTLKIVSGDEGAPSLACVSADITPDIGTTVTSLVTFLPLVVLILVAIATASAAVLSPWGTLDVFRWTSNYGRDADLLRLITPGFGDCLQYIQFVVLAGSLSLNYPGFYQPVVSQASWSALMFNESFVSHGNGTQSLVDGVYAVNCSYGLDCMSQLVGMTHDEDLWAGMIIWLLVIVAAIVVIIQVGFLCRWAYRLISNTREEDLRAKNLPFTIGNAIRIVFNYFLLPLVTLSMYQLVVASSSPPSAVGLAALTLVLVIGFAGWLLWLVATTKPRSYLFDDLPTVLLYGPLYNTYSDTAATFALIPVMLNFVRGIAIGAVQPSGIAQIVLLAICEVITILMLNAFRPFSSPTSMNAFHTFFAVVRLITILLSVAFIPSLSVDDAPRGWIGYIILLLHAITLFVGFLLHSLQTLTEVIARLAGAGGEEGVGGGATRGGLVRAFGMRQLSRRNPRRVGRSRHSVASDAAMLSPEQDQKSVHLNGGRSRSISGSSAILLNRGLVSDGNRTSVGLDSVSLPGANHSRRVSLGGPHTPTTPGGQSSHALDGSQIGGQGSSRGGIVNLKSAETADPYYRPPRRRAPTIDTFAPYTPGGRSRSSWASGDWARKQSSQQSPEPNASPDLMEGPSVSGRATPAYARDRSDSNLEDVPRTSKTDYATREVDYYYNIRGPALSQQPTRRLKTGPADPTGPVSSATGWFKNIFGGKTKEKGKGFEVVRSSRVPNSSPHPVAIPLDDQGPYTDNPALAAPELSRDLALSDEGDAIGGGTRHLPDEDSQSPLESDGAIDDDEVSSDDYPSSVRASQLSMYPPSLPTIDTVGNIEMPSRIASKASSKPSRRSSRKVHRVPTVPRKSSKRTSSQGDVDLKPPRNLRLSTVAPSPPSSPPRNLVQNFSRLSPQPVLQSSGSTSPRLPFDSKTPSTKSNRLSAGAESGTSSELVQSAEGNNAANHAEGHARHSSSALGGLAPPNARNGRPSSVGYVQQHRASDNIHTGNSTNHSMLSSSAEIIEGPPRSSISPER